MGKHIQETDLKTINGESLIGDGNIIIEGTKVDNKTVSLNENGEIQLGDENNRIIPDNSLTIDLIREDGGGKHINILANNNVNFLIADAGVFSTLRVLDIERNGLVATVPYVDHAIKEAVEALPSNEVELDGVYIQKNDDGVLTIGDDGILDTGIGFTNRSGDIYCTVTGTGLNVGGDGGVSVSDGGIDVGIVSGLGSDELYFFSPKGEPSQSTRYKNGSIEYNNRESFRHTTYKLPDSIDDKEVYFPISVNGVEADSSGNIELPIEIDSVYLQKDENGVITLGNNGVLEYSTAIRWESRGNVTYAIDGSGILFENSAILTYGQLNLMGVQLSNNGLYITDYDEGVKKRTIVKDQGIFYTDQHDNEFGMKLPYLLAQNNTFVATVNNIRADRNGNIELPQSHISESNIGIGLEYKDNKINLGTSYDLNGSKVRTIKANEDEYLSIGKYDIASEENKKTASIVIGENNSIVQVLVDDIDKGSSNIVMQPSYTRIVSVDKTREKNSSVTIFDNSIEIKNVNEDNTTAIDITQNKIAVVGCKYEREDVSGTIVSIEYLERKEHQKDKFITLMNYKGVSHYVYDYQIRKGYKLSDLFIGEQLDSLISTTGALYIVDINGDSLYEFVAEQDSKVGDVAIPHSLIGKSFYFVRPS